MTPEDKLRTVINEIKENIDRQKYYQQPSLTVQELESIVMELEYTIDAIYEGKAE